MVVSTRSGMVGKANDSAENSTEASSSIDLSHIDSLLEPLKGNIEGINNTLTEIRIFFETKFIAQNIVISKLLTRVTALEAACKLNNHITLMQDRKIDDQEQFSRKVNLQIENIEIFKNDSPQLIMQRIKEEAEKLHLNIPDSDYDRCHRVGKKYMKNGKWQQKVLLKLGTWRTRDLIYRRRKDLPFKILPDLTARRQSIFNSAKKELYEASFDIEKDDDTNEITGGSAISRSFDFVMVDINCKLKVKTHDNRFFAFSSLREFFCLAAKVDTEQCCSDVLLDDEKHGKPDNLIPYDLYY